MMNRAKSSLVVLGLLILSGCGSRGPDYGSLDLSEADGRVTLDGEPLADALVLFEAPDQSYSYAMTDGGGNFRLMFNSEESGVTKGPKTVRIWSSRGVPGMAEAGIEEDPDAKPKEAERVPARYNVRSELTENVEDNSHTFNFDLTSS